MKLKKIKDFTKAERRQLSLIQGKSEHGKSTVYIKCPFCGSTTEAYIWSLAGSGKRCDNEECQAKLYYGFAIRDMIPTI